MERFENSIFKQREEINDRMAKMFRILKELTTSRAPKKVLIRDEAKSLVTKNINSIFLARGEKERNENDDMAIDGGINGIDMEMPKKEAKKEIEAENGIKNKPIKRTKEEETTKASRPAETNIRLFLASHSNIYPLGIVENVLVDVPSYVYLMDFMILDIIEDEKRPFILGIPFLTTAKAVIKFDKGIIYNTPSWTDSEVARLLAISSPPASPLSPWCSPPPQIPFPPLPPILSPPSPILAPAPPPSPIRSLGYRATMIRLRDEAASISPPPSQLPSASRREDRPEVTLPPQKRLDIALGTRYEDMDEIYTRLDDEQTKRQLLAGRLNMLFRDRRTHAHTRMLMEAEVRMSREAWTRATDASDLDYDEVISLRTT
nr:hypothetical protein [Tanacetum cinerariifolium]